MFWRRVASGLAVVALVGWATGVATADLIGKDSADFPAKFKYEMADLPSAVDQDGNSVNDFQELWGAGGTNSISGDVWSISGKSNLMSSENPSRIWDANQSDLTWANGYTVEARVKILSSTSFPFKVAANPFGTPYFGIMKVSSTGEAFENEDAFADNNSDDFHVFRMAQAAGSNVWYLWRDGVLKGTTTAPGFNCPGIPQLWYGNGGAVADANVQVDYLRFTSGAYAPVPEPATLTLAALGMVGLLAYAWRRRK